MAISEASGGAVASPTVAGGTAPAALASAPRANFLARIPAPYWFAGLITLILVIGEAFYNILGGYERLAIALGCAVISEELFSRVLRGKFVNPLSAYITGNSIVILTKPGSVLWPFALGALISITSKYVLQYRGRHLWNPTNFGITAMLLLAPKSIAVLSHEWGNSWAVLAIVWSVGFIVAWRASVFHVTISYLLTFLALAPLRALVSGDPLLSELAPVTGPMYTLFMFFMITDPRTVVRARNWRIFVAVIIGVSETAIRMLNEFDLIHVEALRSAPPLFALAIIGPIAMLIDLAHTPKRT